MNWSVSALDKITLISNSDAHSASRLGREANVFETDLSYNLIIEAIKSKDPKKFLSTIEFFPEEGKYHFDGHRSCQVVFSPEETKKHKGLCPKCGRPLTIGVLNRVFELADRPKGRKPAGAIPFRSLIPLEEIIADALDVGVGTKSVQQVYKELINRSGNESKILLESERQAIESASSRQVAEAVVRVREGKVKILPGYDGEYGKIEIFSQGERESFSKQKSLF